MSSRVGGHLRKENKYPCTFFLHVLIPLEGYPRNYGCHTEREPDGGGQNFYWHLYLCVSHPLNIITWITPTSNLHRAAKDEIWNLRFCEVIIRSGGPLYLGWIVPEELPLVSSPFNFLHLIKFLPCISDFLTGSSLQFPLYPFFLSYLMAYSNFQILVTLQFTCLAPIITWIEQRHLKRTNSFLPTSPLPIFSIITQARNMEPPSPHPPSIQSITKS